MLHHAKAAGACLVCSNIDRQGGPRGISPKFGPEVASHTHTQKKWPAITQQQQSSTPPAIGIPLSEHLSTQHNPAEHQNSGEKQDNSTPTPQSGASSVRNHPRNTAANSPGIQQQQSPSSTHPESPESRAARHSRWYWELRVSPSTYLGPWEPAPLSHSTHRQGVGSQHSPGPP